MPFLFRCVRLARFENDRTIAFVPPDGSFDLMTYRLSTQVSPQCLEFSLFPLFSFFVFWKSFLFLKQEATRTLFFFFQVKPLIWVEAQIEKHSRSRMEITVKARSQFKERRYG